MRCGSETLEFKDTEAVFIFGIYEDDDGTPLAVPDNIICHIRTLGGELVATLNPVLDDVQIGRFTLTMDAKLPVGRYEGDLLFYDNTHPDMPTENNFDVVVRRGISRKTV